MEIGKAAVLFLFCTLAQASRNSDHGLLGLTRMTESDADSLDGLIRAARAIRGSSFPVPWVPFQPGPSFQIL